MLKFTSRASGTSVWINPFLVCSVWKTFEGTEITFAASQQEVVDESAEEVANAIEQALFQATRPPLSAFA